MSEFKKNQNQIHTATVLMKRVKMEAVSNKYINAYIPSLPGCKGPSDNLSSPKRLDYRVPRSERWNGGHTTGTQHAY